MSEVRIAVVGAGLIGQQHILRTTREPGAALAAIVDPAERSKELAAALGTKWFPDLATMLQADRPDAAIIATPNQLHVANGLEAVAAGLPMLIEKPLAEDVASGQQLVEAAEAAGVPLLVGHHRRHNPLIQRAKAIVASGRLGRITIVNALSWFLKPDDYFDVAWRREPGGGPVLINLIHVVDDLRNLCGEVDEVRAIESNAIRRFRVEDTAAALVSFENGALGTISISDTVAAPWSWELTAGENQTFPETGEFCYLIGGTDGSMSFPRLDMWHYQGERSWQAPIDRAQVVAPKEDPLALQLRHFCRVARGQERPLVDGREALRTLEVTLAVKAAAAGGGPVSLR